MHKMTTKASNAVTVRKNPYTTLLEKKENKNRWLAPFQIKILIEMDTLLESLDLLLLVIDTVIC